MHDDHDVGFFFDVDDDNNDTVFVDDHGEFDLHVHYDDTVFVYDHGAFDLHVHYDDDVDNQHDNIVNNLDQSAD